MNAKWPRSRTQVAWSAAVVCMTLLISAALLLAAMSPPSAGLGYLVVAVAACVFAGMLKQRARVGITSFMVALVLIAAAFIPSMIPYAVCRYDHICRAPGDLERSMSLATIIGVPVALAILALMVLSLSARETQQASA